MVFKIHITRSAKTPSWSMKLRLADTQLPTRPGSAGAWRPHVLLVTRMETSFNDKSRSAYQLSLTWPHRSGLGLWSYLLNIHQP